MRPSSCPSCSVILLHPVQVSFPPVLPHRSCRACLRMGCVIRCRALCMCVRSWCPGGASLKPERLCGSLSALRAVRPTRSRSVRLVPDAQGASRGTGRSPGARQGPDAARARAVASSGRRGHGRRDGTKLGMRSRGPCVSRPEDCGASRQNSRG